MFEVPIQAAIGSKLSLGQRYALAQGRTRQMLWRRCSRARAAGETESRQETHEEAGIGGSAAEAFLAVLA